MLAGIIFNGLGIPVVAVLLLATIPLLLFGTLGYLVWHTQVTAASEQQTPAPPSPEGRAPEGR